MPDLSFQPTAWPRKDTGQEEAVRLNPRCPPLALACAWHCPSFSPPGGQADCPQQTPLGKAACGHPHSVLADRVLGTEGEGRANLNPGFWRRSPHEVFRLPRSVWLLTSNALDSGAAACGRKA